MIRFIHTADIHFGVENYGRIDSATGIHTRLLDFQRCLNFCIDYAIDQKLDFFLFSGDAYKTAHPSPTQQRLLMQCLLRLYEAGIPVIIVVGNHDHPLSFGKAHALNIFADLPVDGFHVIAKPTALTLQTKNGPIQIVGIPWPTRNTVALQEDHKQTSATELADYIAKQVALIIQALAEQLDPTIPAVLAGHLTVSSGIFSGSEKRAIYGSDPTLLPSQLAIVPFDYVALGHLHRYQDLNKNGYPSVVYSGSIERVDFGERKEAKGFCVISVEKKGTTTHEFIKTPARPFIQIDCILKPEGDQTEQLLNEIQKKDLNNAVVKINYTVPETKKDSVDLKAVSRACKEAHYIVSITPICKPTIRHTRPAVKVEMALKDLLDAYFETKPALKEKKESLIKQALQLQQEWQQKETPET